MTNADNEALTMHEKEAGNDEKNLEQSQTEELNEGSESSLKKLDDLPAKCQSLRLRSIQKRLEAERRKNEPKQSEKKTRTRSSAPLSRYRRKTANARERQRMHEVNMAFDRLKTSIPHHKLNQIDEKKDTKITTLRCAISYIAALSELLEDLNQGRTVSPEYFCTDAELGIDSDSEDEADSKKRKNKKSKGKKKGRRSNQKKKADKKKVKKVALKSGSVRRRRSTKDSVLQVATKTNLADNVYQNNACYYGANNNACHSVSVNTFPGHKMSLPQISFNNQTPLPRLSSVFYSPSPSFSSASSPSPPLSTSSNSSSCVFSSAQPVNHVQCQETLMQPQSMPQPQPEMQQVFFSTTAWKDNSPVDMTDLSNIEFYIEDSPGGDGSGSGGSTSSGLGCIDYVQDFLESEGLNISNLPAHPAMQTHTAPPTLLN